MATNPREIGELTLSIAAEIRAQRAARRWGQEELGAAADIVPSTLSRMERGRTAIDVEQLGRLAGALGMTPEDFLATARRHEAERQRRGEDVYLADGSVDPAVGTTVSTPPEHVQELLARKRPKP